MIGFGLKKYAQELGLKTENGIAYGTCGRYMLSMSEGAGYKSVAFAVTFPDASSKAALQSVLLDGKFQSEHRIIGADITDAMILLKFHDTVGTMAVIKNTVSAVHGMLEQNGVWGVECCNACRTSTEGGADEVLIDGNVFVMHTECVGEVYSRMAQDAEEVKKSGSLGMGILGAALGAVVGAIPWAVAFYFGYFVAWLGFLVALASKKGYELLGGRETKAKLISIIASSLISIVAVEIFVYFIDCYSYLSLYEMSFIEIVNSFLLAFSVDPQLCVYVISDILIGWLFAGIGIFYSVRGAFSKVRSNTAVPQILGRR